MIPFLMAKKQIDYLGVDFRNFISPESYFSKCDVDVRTSYRKCFKAGYEIKKYEEISEELSAQLYNIWVSSKIRQGREINLNYETINGQRITICPNRWPIVKYGSLLNFYALEMDSKVVAYLELLTDNKVDIVHSTLGHFDYLKLGIMKTLFFEVIKIRWNIVDRLEYGTKDQLNFFKKDLLFK